MTNISTFDRYKQVLADDLRINLNRYIKFMASGLGVAGALIAWLAYIGRGLYTYAANILDSSEISILTFTFGIMSALAASSMFRLMSTKGGTINMLMQPATQLEKFVARLTIVVPIFIIAFLVGAWAIDLIRYAIISIKYPDIDTQMIFPYIFGQKIFWKTLLWIVSGQSLFILGSAIWPRRAFLNTILASIILYIIYAIYFTVLFVAFPPNYGFFMDFETWPDFTLLSPAINIVINYTIAYYRFKESEIIHRW